jgi:hypothetical protein
MKKMKFLVLGLVIVIIAGVVVANTTLSNKSNVNSLHGVTLQNLEALTQEFNPPPPGYAVCYSTYRTYQSYSWEMLTTMTKCNGCGEINVYWYTDQSSCKPSGGGGMFV